MRKFATYWDDIMFGKNQAQEKFVQPKPVSPASPLQPREPLQKITLREVPPKIQYGKGEYVSFATFAASHITHNEKLFSRKFVLHAYANLFEVAIISGSNNPFSYRPEMCLWIKNKMDTLIVSEQEKIQEFVAYLKKFQEMIEQFDAPSEHQIKFLITLRCIFLDVIHYVSQRCPQLSDKLSDDGIEKLVLVLAEYPTDFPKTELIGRVNRDDYVVTEVKDGASLFSASWAENTYKKLIDMSQKCGSSRMLYRYDACIEIKELIEKSKIDWESYRAVIVKIPSEIKQATGVNGTEHFVATLASILKDVVDYISMVHPELEKTRQDHLKKLIEESAALKNELADII